MDILIDFLTPLTAWHWLGLCLVLLGIEMLVGTFDLLWIAVAAGLTALIASFIPMEVGGQLVFFSVATIGLLILGRTAFAKMRNPPTTHPKLNDRADSLVGKSAIVSDAFVAGKGKVKLGDTYWLAESIDGSDLGEGTTVKVNAAESTLLKVSAA